MEPARNNEKTRVRSEEKRYYAARNTVVCRIVFEDTWLLKPPGFNWNLDIALATAHTPSMCVIFCNCTAQ